MACCGLSAILDIRIPPALLRLWPACSLLFASCLGMLSGPTMFPCLTLGTSTPRACSIRPALRITIFWRARTQRPTGHVRSGHPCAIRHRWPESASPDSLSFISDQASWTSTFLRSQTAASADSSTARPSSICSSVATSGTKTRITLEYEPAVIVISPCS